MVANEFKKHSYDKSPLHTAVSTLVKSIDELKNKIKNKTIPATKKEVADLEQFHKIWASLHKDILPIFSAGRGPGLFDLGKGISFGNLVDKFSLKDDVNTSLDFEIGHLMLQFTTSLQDKELNHIAPFFNPAQLPSQVADQMKKLGIDDLFIPNQFKTNFSKKHTALASALEAYSSRKFEVKPAALSTMPLLDNSPTTSKTAKTAISTDTVADAELNRIPQEESAQQALSADSDRVNTILDTISEKCSSILEMGHSEKNDALVQSSAELQDHLDRLRDKYNHSQLTHDDSTQFRANINKTLNDIDAQQEHVSEPSILSSLTSSLSQLLVKLFISLVQCLISSIFSVTTNPNGFFKPTNPDGHTRTVIPQPDRCCKLNCN